MMPYLQASWGFVIVIGGFCVTLVVLMVLDGPAQQADQKQRQS